MTITSDPSTGYDPRTKLDEQSGSVFLSGTQGLIRALFEQMRRDRDAGLKTAAFVSGYPGSPLGGFDIELARFRDRAADLGITHLPGHNEEMAATSVYGTQVAQTFPDATHDGVVGVWYGKSPGLDRAADGIRHAQYMGTSRHGGVLALVGDDPSCKSSTLPCSTEHTLIDLGLPALAPASVEDIITLGQHGIAMSRVSGLWTGMRIVTDIADGSASLSGRPTVPEIITPTIEWEGAPFTPSLRGIAGPPHSARMEAEIRGPRLRLAREYGYLNKLNRVTFEPTTPQVSIIAVGHLYGVLQSALANLGLDDAAALERAGIRLCHVRLQHPLDPRDLRAFAAGVGRVILVEEKRPVVEGKLREALYGGAHQPLIVGKTDEHAKAFLPLHGAVQADDLTSALYRTLRTALPETELRTPAARRLSLPLLEGGRAPFFCSGCPHNTSTKVPEGALVGAGIGCHGMAMFMDSNVVGDVGSTTHMGCEGAQWFGIQPYVGSDHMFQNIGDGTYFHSGQLAVQAAVAAGAHITYKLLYNGAIAMTGGQDPAESNALPVEDIAHIMTRQGVKKIIITTDDTKKYRGVRLPATTAVWDRARVIDAQEALRAVPGVTVLIHDQRCAAEVRRDRKRGRAPVAEKKVLINERICEGCGDCGAKSNCLSVEPVETAFGRKTQINQTSCNSDFSCLAGDCPSFVTVRPARRRRRAAGADTRTTAPKALPDLPELPEPPVAAAANGATRIRMPGIGGTGVVTASQIIGTAAMLEGMNVRGMDQTGMSQKAGPVISDLTISSAPISTESRLSGGTVDLVLGFDILGVAMPDVQNTLRPGHSVAVISTTRTPTGAMVSDVTKSWPDTERFVADLTDLLGADKVWLADATEVTGRLFGNSVGANVFLIGMAVQTGALPVRPVSIERAITLNGVAVKTNLAAFAAGRWYVEDPERLASDGEPVPDQERAQGVFLEKLAGAGLAGRMLDATLMRSEDLIGYQNKAYARRYVDGVCAVAAAEHAVTGTVGDLTEAAAHQLYKLMAYKDEYEVARLAFDVDEIARLESAYGPGSRVYLHLHPPVLRDRGMTKKLVLGGWFRPVLRSLAHFKGLRGTAFDPFGRTEVRRLERTLIREYEAALELVVKRLRPETYDAAIAVAKLPDTVRGYEELKLRSGEAFRTDLVAALRALPA